MPLSFMKGPSRSLYRGLATVAEGLKNAEKPPQYTLATLRSFPSLEPHSVMPVHTKFLQAPLRRDILWLAVVMELDNRRVGASNPPGRSQHKYSRRKLLPEKGNGKARVGDGNSPIRFRGAQALARNAPNDFSSTIPIKEYRTAYRIALSDAYNRGHLYIIDDTPTESKLLPGDSNGIELCTSDFHAVSRFVKHHELGSKLSALFVPTDYLKSAKLREAVLRYPSSKLRVMDKSDVEVRDLLKAHRIYIEKGALEYFALNTCK